MDLTIDSVKQSSKIYTGYADITVFNRMSILSPIEPPLTFI